MKRKNKNGKKISMNQLIDIVTNVQKTNQIIYKHTSELMSKVNPTYNIEEGYDSGHYRGCNQGLRSVMKQVSDIVGGNVTLNNLIKQLEMEV